MIFKPNGINICLHETKLTQYFFIHEMKTKAFVDKLILVT